jgi:hypothetical protein
MVSAYFRFLVLFIYTVQFLSFGFVYAQTKTAPPTVTVYKTPT